MKLSTFKRLIKEDVEEQYRPLIEKIAFALNPFAEEVVQAFNKNLSIEDNFNQSKKEVTVQVDTNGTPITAVLIKTDLGKNCAGIQVIRALNITSPTTYVNSCPFLSFTELNGVITINNITGLPANNKFKLKLILYS